MKASVYTEYGGPDVLHLQELEKPSPKSNEVLVRVHAVSVNYGDIIARISRTSRQVSSICCRFSG